MKRKFAIVILLAFLVILSIPTVAVVLVKANSSDHHIRTALFKTRENRENLEEDPKGSPTRSKKRSRSRSRSKERQREEKNTCVGMTAGPTRPIMSRGPTCEYKHIGILTVGPSEGNQGPVSLFGRPTHRGSDRWNYYALSNQHVPQKLPVFGAGSMDCAKLKGCPEASDGDVLDVRGYGRASVTLYNREFAG
jgi:hypothetical protein